MLNLGDHSKTSAQLVFNFNLSENLCTPFLAYKVTADFLLGEP